MRRLRRGLVNEDLDADGYFRGYIGQKAYPRHLVVRQEILPDDLWELQAVAGVIYASWLRPLGV